MVALPPGDISLAVARIPSYGRMFHPTRDASSLVASLDLWRQRAASVSPPFDAEAGSASSSSLQSFGYSLDGECHSSVS